MSSAPVRRTPPALQPTPIDPGLVFSVAVARYGTPVELAAYLRGLRSVSRGRLVVVLALPDTGYRVFPDHDPKTTRLVITAGALVAPSELMPAWFVADPAVAVTTAMTGLEQGDALVLLFPTDWTGADPEELVDRARRWRAGPHSPNDDVYFSAEPSN